MGCGVRPRSGAGAPARDDGLPGPSEAWFIEAHESYAGFEKMQLTMDGNAALRADGDKFSAVDGDLLSRASAIIARYRPGLSYSANLNLPRTRYMTVDVVRRKPGHAGDFAEVWRAIVEAHTRRT